jgi:hypothetical protein
MPLSLKMRKIEGKGKNFILTFGFKTKPEKYH